jgi:hypothetical protein
MKKTLLMTILVGFGFSYSAWAGACVSGDTLAEYIALGSTGCTIGNLDFSQFSYSPTGVNTPTAGEVNVDTIMGTESGLEFDAGWFARSGNEQDSLIKYTVTCEGCSITDLVLKMGGDFPFGDSSINVAETEDNSLVPSLGVEAVGGGTTINSASETFGPEGTLNLSKDIHIDGGDDGNSASVSSVTNLFSTTQTSMTPEPSLLLLCSGFLVLVPIAARKLRGGSR